MVLKCHSVQFWDFFELLYKSIPSLSAPPFVGQVSHTISLQMNVPSEFPALALCLTNSTEEGAEWMSESKLKMNGDKTEIFASGTNPKISHVTSNLIPKPFSQSVQNLDL